MKCAACNAEIADKAKFCNECGAPLPRRCDSCGGVNSSKARFCDECGALLGGPRGEQASPPPERKAEPVPEPIHGEAERRQLTVLFCDIVGSTRLSSHLDPEDLRDIVRAYQQAAEEVILRYGGHLAQRLGDGLLVYFGYPRSYEDNEQRAVHTGLALLVACRTLNVRLESEFGVRLALRVGIHTGPVVVGL